MYKHKRYKHLCIMAIHLSYMAKQKGIVSKEVLAIGDRLKVRRLRHSNATQELIAEELGMHAISYGRIENGLTELKITKAMALARYYGITIDELVGYEQSKENSVTVQDPPSSYGEPPVNITIQIGGSGENSPRAQRFLDRLGKLLLEEDEGEE